MRISDWSSDVCSSDLVRSRLHGAKPPCRAARMVASYDSCRRGPDRWAEHDEDGMPQGREIDLGRVVDGCPGHAVLRRAASSSAERRVGKGCGSTCQLRLPPSLSKK